MARSLPGAMAFATSLSNGVKLVVNRRSYAGAAAATRRSSEDKMLRKKVKSGGDSAPGTPATSAWIPDPVTGYYRPANRRVEADAAELRETLLTQK